MSRKVKILLAVLTAAFLLVTVPIGIVAVFVFYSFPNFDEQEHLPDSILIQNFHANRQQFENLRTKLERDRHIRRIDDNWSDPPNIAPEVLREYRSLFAVIGTQGLHNWRDPVSIKLIASSRGWAASGSSKGYVYLAERPKSLEAELDSHTFGSGGYGPYYRHIDGNWYLYFER